MSDSILDSLKCYVGRECLAVESGLITHIEISDFAHDGKLIEARAKVLANQVCSYDLVRDGAGGRAPSDQWISVPQEPLTFSTEESRIFLFGDEYVQFCYTYGSVRLFFSPRCVALFRSRDLSVVDGIFSALHDRC